MLSSRSPIAVLVMLISTLCVLIFNGPVATAGSIPPSISGASTSAGTEASAPIGVMTLPHRTIHHPNGVVEQVATPAAMAKLQAARAIYGCGYTCDGKDPNSYQFQGSTCNDAETVATVSQGGATAELRFSGRCQTAWSRTCCYVRAGGFGYTGSNVQRSSVTNYSGVYSGSKVWTAMLYDGSPTTFRACFDLIVAGSGHDWACTLKY